MPYHATSPAIQATLEKMLQLHPKVIDLSLARIHALLAKLGHPEQQLPPVIHVAGTNGKGSVCALLTAMFQSAGKRVHRYTSPHLVRFNERIVLADQEIDDALLQSALEEVLHINGSAPITFFEITTAAAFLLFSRTPADVLILEVGLGGRLDATNCIKQPLASVITSISHDHHDFLGTTLPAIAREKAGIIKPACPVFSARQHDDVQTVLQHIAQERTAPLAIIHPPQIPLTCALVGNHQQQNAALACAVARHLALPEAAIQQGLQTVHWPARLQQLRQGTLMQHLPAGWELWLDGGHNPDAARSLATTCAHWRVQGIMPAFIIGLGANKPAEEFLTPLLPYGAAVAFIPIPDHASHAPAHLQAVAHKLHPHSVINACTDAQTALSWLASCGIEEQLRVLITGSLYLAGNILQHTA